jgi:hypothetical protein
MWKIKAKQKWAAHKKVWARMWDGKSVDKFFFNV